MRTSEREIGAATGGTSRAAIGSYVHEIVNVLDACAAALKPRGRFVIVVNDTIRRSSSAPGSGCSGATSAT